jgi:hypothetical protein
MRGRKGWSYWQNKIATGRSTVCNTSSWFTGNWFTSNWYLKKQGINKDLAKKRIEDLEKRNKVLEKRINDLEKRNEDLEKVDKRRIEDIELAEYTILETDREVSNLKLKVSFLENGSKGELRKRIEELERKNIEFNIKGGEGWGYEEC